VELAIPRGKWIKDINDARKKVLEKGDKKE